MSDPRNLAIGAVLFVLLVVVVRLLRAASHPPRRPPLRTAAAGVAAVGAAWMLANVELEGDILLVVTRGHGLTEGDIPALVLFVVAAGMVIRSWLPRRPARPGDEPPTEPRRAGPTGPTGPTGEPGPPVTRRPSPRRAS